MARIGQLLALWCSSNSITNDTIRLQLSKLTLIGPGVKWYINQPSAPHGRFSLLAIDFLTFFQLLVHHDSGLELLTHSKQTTATHILDYIHERRKCRILCKA